MAETIKVSVTEIKKFDLPPRPKVPEDVKGLSICTQIFGDSSGCEGAECSSCLFSREHRQALIDAIYKQCE